MVNNTGGGPYMDHRKPSISMSSYRSQKQKRLEMRKDHRVLPYPIVPSTAESVVGRIDEAAESVEKLHDHLTGPLSLDMYDIYLNFKDKNLQSKENWLAFLSFKRSDGNIQLQCCLLILMGIYVGTRFLFASDLIQYASNPPSFAALLFAAMTALLLIITLFMRLSLVPSTHDFILFRWLNPITMNFYNSSYGQYLDDGVVICAALTSGLLLISHAHDSVSIAPDIMILSFIVVVVFQLVARGVSRSGLISAWIVIIVCINITLYLVGTGSQEFLYLNGELFLYLALSYEMERQPLRQYIMSVRVLEASEASANALAKSAILIAADNQRRHAIARTTAEALASTAKLLAAANEIEHVAAYSAEKAFTTTLKLLSAENDAQKLVAVAEAKALATTAVLLAAANELQNEHAVELATTLANTGSILWSFGL